jgi:PAS domain S-box-containing protein
MFTNAMALTASDLKSAIISAPLIVKPDTMVLDAIAQMSGMRTLCETTKTADGQNELHLEARSSCVLVVEDEHLLGILTERDVVRLSAQQCLLENLSIREVMIHPVITLYESAFTDFFFAINLLQQYRIRHIPILDEQDRVAGLLTNESLRHTSRPVDLLQLRLVSEVMIREVICAMPNSSMLEIAQLMANHRVSSVVIVQTCGSQAEPPQIPMGILTERDIVQFQALGLHLETCLAGAVMSTPIFSVRPDDSLWVVQQLMEQRLIRRLAVTGEQGELLGIVTQTSLLQALNSLELYKLAEVLEEKVGQLEAEKIELLETRTVELEQQVEARTIALKAKAEREKLVAAIATQIRSSLSLQTILDTTVEQMRQVLGCNRVNIWQLDADGQTIVVAESTNSSLSLVGERVNDNCFKQDWVEIYRQGRIRVVPDIYTTKMATCHRDILIRLQSRAKILAPILCGDELWGFLNASEIQYAREWQPEEIELLQALSVQLAIAIQQATIHQKLQEQLIERQQTEARLRESEQRYITLTAAAPVGIFRTDAEGNSIYSNQRCCEMLGLFPEATSGNGWQQAIHPDDRAHVIAETIRARQENRPFQLEYRILRPDGTAIWVLGQAVAERDANGQAIGYVGTITDISDRKQVEEALHQLNQELETQVEHRTAALQASEANNRAILEAIPDLLLRLRRDGTCLAYIKSGIGAENFLPIVNHISEVLPPELLEKQLQIIEQAITTGELQVYEHQFLKHDRTIYEEVRILAINDHEVLAIVRDIRDRKQAELRLQQQVEQERLLGSITQRMRASLNLEEILNTTVEEIHQILQSDRVLVYRVFPGGTGAAIAESVLPNLPKILEIVFPEEVFPEENYDRYVRGRVYNLRDREDKNQFVLPCLVEFLAEIQVRAKLVVPIVQNQTLWGLLIAHQCDHPRQWQQWEINLLQQVANQLAIAIQQANLYEQLQQELTERQQAEAKLTESNQQLAISNEELARATRLKDEFLANMSHELRTPLNAILGMTEGLQEGVFGTVDERQIKALQTVERSGSHLLELINDILDVAKIESGQMELNCIPTSINHLCQSSLAFVKQQAFKKQIQLNMSLQPDLGEMVLDERRIRQVLINLLTNAVKFTPIGGRVTLEVHYEPMKFNLAERIPLTRTTKLPRLYPEAESCSLEDRCYLCISVIDTGIGIAPSNQTKLFRPFVQIDSSLNRQYEGTGLGLMLVKQIVELHGGDVSLRSQLGQGSCFTVCLPYVCKIGDWPTLTLSLSPDQVQSPEVIATFEPVAELAIVDQSLILIAEDNEANISTVSSYLRAKGYRILLAKNGQEAIDLAKTHQPDLILMDIQMPGVDGLDAIKQVRLNPNLVDIPIIALTALAMTGDREKCLEAGATDYLTKPVKLAQLTNTIYKLLAAKEVGK